MSGAITEDTAVATLTAGAVDYVLKDNLARLAPAVQRAVEGADLRRRQRRDAEQARQSQFAIDHASQAIVYVSEDGRILYVNHAAERFGGLRAADAVGQRSGAGLRSRRRRQQWGRLWEAGCDGPHRRLRGAGHAVLRDASVSSRPRWSGWSATRARS